VPPRDGDGIFSDTDGELLAQVIPLRRREAEQDEWVQRQPFDPEPTETFDAAPWLDAAQDLSSPVERSVWDQPITELRRREALSPARSSLASTLRTGAAWNRPPQRWAIAAAMGIIGVAVIALAFGALHSQSGARAPGAVSASVDAKLASTSSTAGEAQRGSFSSQPSPAHHQQKARGREHRSRVSRTARQLHPDTHATDTVREYLSAGSGADTSTTVEHSAATTSVTSVPQPQHAVEDAPASSRSPSPSHAPAAAPAQSSCVPGELGC
jgi:hypothetical protein